MIDDLQPFWINADWNSRENYSSGMFKDLNLKFFLKLRSPVLRICAKRAIRNWSNLAGLNWQIGDQEDQAEIVIIAGQYNNLAKERVLSTEKDTDAFQNSVQVFADKDILGEIFYFKQNIDYNKKVYISLNLEKLIQIHKFTIVTAVIEHEIGRAIGLPIINTKKRNSIMQKHLSGQALNITIKDVNNLLELYDYHSFVFRKVKYYFRIRRVGGTHWVGISTSPLFSTINKRAYWSIVDKLKKDEVLECAEKLINEIIKRDLLPQPHNFNNTLKSILRVEKQKAIKKSSQLKLTKQKLLSYQKFHSAHKIIPKAVFNNVNVYLKADGFGKKNYTWLCKCIQSSLNFWNQTGYIKMHFIDHYDKNAIGIYVNEHAKNTWGRTYYNSLMNNSFGNTPGIEMNYSMIFAESPDLKIRTKLFIHVLIHELGHAIGLPHVKDPQSIMYPYTMPEWISTGHLSKEVDFEESLYRPKLTKLDIKHLQKYFTPAGKRISRIYYYW